MTDEEAPNTSTIVLIGLLLAAGIGSIAGMIFKLVLFLFGMSGSVFWIGFILGFIFSGIYIWIYIRTGGSM